MSEAHSAVRPYATASGALLALSAAPFAVVPGAAAAAAVLPAVCLLSAGLIIVKQPRPGRALATLGALGLLACAIPRLAGDPALAFSAVLLAMISLAGLWDVLASPATRRPLLAARAYGAAAAALMFWIAMAVLRPRHQLSDWIPVTAAFLIAGALGLNWAWAARGGQPRRSAFLAGCALVALALGMTLRDGAWTPTAAGALYTLAAVAVLPRARRPGIEPLAWWEPLLGHPERLLAGTFLALCLMGTILLALPLSAAARASIGLLDAAFTSVSAVCVTGLIVRDTPGEFSRFGQGVILALIQVGGLGIMTFSTAVLRVLGRRMSLRTEGAAASLINVRDRGQLAGAARRILVLTFAAETAGTLLLLPRFLAHGDTWPMALWRAVFTSVSAFCNAGFALQPDSLISYQTDPFVLHTVALLIIAGGLSPVAVYALPDLLRRAARPVTVQARLGLAAAAFLLSAGFIFLLTVEWNHALEHLAWMDRLHNAWFQSVTLRTAGFNSVDIALFQPASLSLAMLWMFVGGNPGGTAGGIKTTTAAVLVLSVIDVVRGSQRVTAFNRDLSERTRHRAVAVVMLASCTVIAAVLALQLTQAMAGVEVLFEVVSALGTVGLSIGATGRLDEAGKIIIAGCMFVGRVGGLSLLMFMSRRSLPASAARPEEEIDVG